MKQVTINIYTFDELSEEAKEKARVWYREHALDYDWWDAVYEDAKNIGLVITGFDLDRNLHCDGRFDADPSDVATRILHEHGPTCPTYDTAQRYISDHDEDEFLRRLLRDYARNLQADAEYLTSDEAVDEPMVSMLYDFTEDGRRFVCQTT